MVDKIKANLNGTTNAILIDGLNRLGNNTFVESDFEIMQHTPGVGSETALTLRANRTNGKYTGEVIRAYTRMDIKDAVKEINGNDCVYIYLTDVKTTPITKELFIASFLDDHDVTLLPKDFEIDKTRSMIVFNSLLFYGEIPYIPKPMKGNFTSYIGRRLDLKILENGPYPEGETYLETFHRLLKLSLYTGVYDQIIWDGIVVTLLDYLEGANPGGIGKVSFLIKKGNPNYGPREVISEFKLVPLQTWVLKHGVTDASKTMISHIDPTEIAVVYTSKTEKKLEDSLRTDHHALWDPAGKIIESNRHNETGVQLRRFSNPFIYINSWDFVKFVKPLTELTDALPDEKLNMFDELKGVE